MNKLMKMNECMNEWKKERMNEWMSQSKNDVRIKWKELNEWIMSE